jgi:hypothetical protein
MFEQKQHLLCSGVREIKQQDLLALVLHEIDAVVHGLIGSSGDRVIGQLNRLPLGHQTAPTQEFG